MLILICGLDPNLVPVSVGRPRAFYNLTNCYLDHHYFCELGGLYKLWKQVNTDIVGLEHYRRFFTEDVKTPDRLLQENTIKNILSSHDIIMSPNHLYSPPKAMGMRSRGSKCLTMPRTSIVVSFE